jgi:hypothetical protein
MTNFDGLPRLPHGRLALMNQKCPRLQNFTVKLAMIACVPM